MKKLFALLMAAVMVIAMFAGCGSSETQQPTADSGETQGAEATGEATENAAAAGAIKLGMCGPLTGGAAVYGTAVKEGMEIAVEEINALGGLQFELKTADDEHNAEKAINAYNSLVDWGMQIMAGPVTTAPSTAVAGECAADGIFMLTPSASGVDVIEAGDNIFQICFTDPNQGTASADYIAEHKLGTKIGVIYDSSDAYSSGIYEKFKAQAEVVGLEIVCAEAFTADNKSDLTNQVTACQKAGADLVFLPFYAVEAAQVLTYANKIGYEPLFFGCDGMDGILTTEGFDPTLAEGLMLLTPFSADSEDEKTQSFVKKYQEKTGIVPNQFAADAYDVIYAIYQACVDGGVTADMTAEEINEIMVEQFTSMTFDGLTGAGMTWMETGEVSKSPMAVVIENGVYVGKE
ncbi:MAG: ABC transporter substrate-binding protein [Oscillospiraceae bacterium]|nr:ABC transporter substrate-binding protein [Oscillospiraceae bacterium]